MTNKRERSCVLGRTERRRWRHRLVLITTVHSHPCCSAKLELVSPASLIARSESVLIAKGLLKEPSHLDSLLFRLQACPNFVLHHHLLLREGLCPFSKRMAHHDRTFDSCLIFILILGAFDRPCNYYFGFISLILRRSGWVCGFLFFSFAGMLEEELMVLV